MRIIRLLFLALAFGSAAWLCTHPLRVKTDLFELIGNAGDSEFQLLLNAVRRNSEKAHILCEGETAQASVDRARTLLNTFSAPEFIEGQLAPAALKAHVSDLTARGGNLLSDDARRALQAGDTAGTAQDAIRQLTTSLAPPLFPLAQDPFLLKTGFVRQATTSFTAPSWQMLNGFIVIEKEARFYTWLYLNLNRIPASGRSALLEELLAAPDLHLSGAPVHTYLTTRATQREINFLTLFSSLVVIGLALFQFRSIRPLLPILAGLCAGAMIGTATLFVFFTTPHILVFVFGTTLIGLTIDYSFHIFIAAQTTRSMTEALRITRRPLISAFLTTQACFAPLFFSELAFLRQVALFTTAGMCCVFAFAQLFYGLVPACWFGEFTPRRAWFPFGRTAKITVVLMVVAFGACSLGKLRVENDVAAFYKPPQKLLAEEQLFLETVGAQASAFAIVRAENVESLLRTEEESALNGLSRLIPSAARQNENRALIQTLFEEQATAFQEAFGMKAPPAFQPTPLLTVENTESPVNQNAIENLLHRTGGGVYSLIPFDAVRETPEGFAVFSPRAMLTQTFEAYSRETRRLLFVSALGMLFLLAILFRRRVFLYLLPLGLTLVILLGGLALMDAPMSLFHLLSLFILIGIGIDYTIFHLSGGRGATNRAVFLSFLTSSASLSGLMFTSFPLIRAMGYILGTGLFFAYLLSFIFYNRNQNG